MRIILKFHGSSNAFSYRFKIGPSNTSGHISVTVSSAKTVRESWAARLRQVSDFSYSSSRISNVKRR